MEIAVGLFGLRDHPDKFSLRLLISVRFEVNLYEVHRARVQSALRYLAIVKL